MRLVEEGYWDAERQDDGRFHLKRWLKFETYVYRWEQYSKSYESYAEACREANQLNNQSY